MQSWFTKFKDAKIMQLNPRTIVKEFAIEVDSSIAKTPRHLNCTRGKISN